jgi:hypothetical protein
MAQNPLHSLVAGSQRVQIGRNSPTEPVPPILLKTDRLDRRTNYSLRQLVYIHPLTGTMVEYDAGTASYT